MDGGVQFADLQATNYPQRFYRLSTPQAVFGLLRSNIVFRHGAVEPELVAQRVRFNKVKAASEHLVGAAAY